MSAITLPATALLAELESEAHATRRLLAAVPADKLDWAPHERSMTLGLQAQHMAGIPGMLTAMLLEDGFDFGAERLAPEQPTSVAPIQETFDTGVLAAKQALQSWTETQLAASWRVTKNGRTLMVPTRSEALRSLLFNHLYHHRGQLMVYLRLLDVPLPSIYGPTADEDPFAD